MLSSIDGAANALNQPQMKADERTSDTLFIRVHLRASAVH
jgi:hypothetical protein